MLNDLKLNNPELIVFEIKVIQDELERTGVKREYINFKRLSPEELLAELDARVEQLKTRKRFLEVNE